MRVFMICRRKAGKDGISLLLKGGKVLPKGELPSLRDCYKTEAAAKAAVAMWETGARMPRADKLPKLAEVLGCSVADLFTTEKTA